MKKLLSLSLTFLLFSHQSYAWENLNDSEKLGIGLAVIGAVKTIADEAKKQSTKTNDKEEIIFEEPRKSVSKPTETTQKATKSVDFKKSLGMFNWTLGDTFTEDSCIKSPVSEQTSDICEVSTQGNKFFNKAYIRFNPKTQEVVQIRGVKSKMINIPKDYLIAVYSDEANFEFRAPPWKDFCSKNMPIMTKRVEEKYNLKMTSGQKESPELMVVGLDSYYYKADDITINMTCFPDEDVFYDFLKANKPYFFRGDSKQEVLAILEYVDFKALNRSKIDSREVIKAKQSIEANKYIDDF